MVWYGMVWHGIVLCSRGRPPTKYDAYAITSMVTIPIAITVTTTLAKPYHSIKDFVTLRYTTLHNNKLRDVGEAHGVVEYGIV